MAQERYPVLQFAGKKENTMTSNNDLASWNERADRFCKAWSSEVGHPDFDTLSKIYATDADIVIYDTLPPIQGFRGLGFYLRVK